MKVEFAALTLVLGLGLVAPAFADDAAVKEDPAKPEAVKEEAAKPAEEGAKPVEAAAPAAAKEEAKHGAAAVPSKETAPAKDAAPAKAAAPAKEMSACAKTYSPLVDSYAKAHADMDAWVKKVDADTSAASEKTAKMQAQIQENEAAITKAKIDKDDAKAKSLAKANKQIWADFNTAKKAQDKACAGFAKEAADHVKQNDDAINQALAAVKAAGK